MTLHIGVIQPYNEEKVKKSKEKAVLGTPFESLFEHMNILEVKHKFDIESIYQELKAEVMEATGRIELAKGGDSEDGNKDQAPEDGQQSDTSGSRETK